MKHPKITVLLTRFARRFKRRRPQEPIGMSGRQQANLIIPHRTCGYYQHPSSIVGDMEMMYIDLFLGVYFYVVVDEYGKALLPELNPEHRFTNEFREPIPNCKDYQYDGF